VAQPEIVVPDGCRIYLITPPRLDPGPFADLLTAALDAGDVAAVQLRLKDVDDDTWRRSIDALRPVCQSRGVAFLLNDRADLAKATGCDGAHVGQDDVPARDARRLIGPDLMLGVTCKGSRDLAMQAGEDGADYVAFGAFYPSTTKAVTALLDPEILLAPSAASRRRTALRWYRPEPTSWRWLGASGTIRTVLRRGCGR
jgi:thiamine-phosphate pyrophosphorylase